MKRYLLLFSLIFLKSVLSAQSFTAKVIDTYYQAIPNAHILNTNTDLHTHSNTNGEFTLDNYSDADVLKVSSIGYHTKFIYIDSLKLSSTIVLDEKIIAIEEVTITPELNALQILTDIDIQTNPVNSSQDILRQVPGLIIGQHAGGGKAEQIFLRGFDIDHGTDITITADGLPVNMVSHAHGQGYADLHFIIPETVDKIDFGKGPYYQNKGNFNTAGYVEFKTKQRLDHNLIKLEVGQFDSHRILGMFDLLEGNKQNAYVATEFISTNGYFDSPQNFKRLNLFGKYTSKLSGLDKFGISFSHFDSKWDASGQVPQRAVDNSMISRFGAIDDTEGGETSRSNVLINYDKIINGNSSVKSKIYLSRYDFELYSNFTFFLEDSINGDQIKQKENRMIFGLSSEYLRSFSFNDIDGNLHAGISLRNDHSKNNELSHTANRKETLEQIQFGDINETNLGSYVGTQLNLNKWSFNPSLRLDYFDFQYNDNLIPTYQTETEKKAILSPKFNILYNPIDELQLYLKTGKGFHSNDTRVVVADKVNQTLPAAYGFDIGYIWKPIPNMLFNMAYWHLHLGQEFVYVGDAGIVEPSGRTKRQGIDLSLRYQAASWLFWNFDSNYTYARATDEPTDHDFIPLAPDFTLTSGLDLIFKKGFYGSINVLHLSDRPANEDNSIVAEGYTIVNLNAGYKWKNISLGFQIQNLLNTEWNETQFATESRLQDEANSVEEIHFTPGTPFFLKSFIQYEF